MARDPVERWRELGSFIRQQRAGARLSVRRLSELAGISNPYLSQIERGLRRPSADILQQIAKALRISAETLYVQAGILDPPGDARDLVEHIRADPHLAESQKQALVQIYLSFRREHDSQQAQDPKGSDDHEHPNVPRSSTVPDRAPADGAREPPRGARKPAVPRVRGTAPDGPAGGGN